MITQKKTANAVGGKTARACESCLKKRASWFCPADDAFLCTVCDSLVHSANELAGRHKRVRLGTASCKLDAPSWHQGFTKKARTPRNHKAKPYHNNNNTYHMPVVPEVSNDDNEEVFSVEENEENDILFSVPTFNFNTNNSNSNKNNHEIDDYGFNISLIGFDGDEWNNMPGFLPSENELAEFAADVESLLEQEETVKMEDDDDLDHNHQGGKKSLHGFFPGVKIEEEGESNNTTDHHCYFDWSIDVESEMLNFDLNYNCVNDESQVSGGEEEEEKKVVVPIEEDEDENNMMEGKKRRKILLRLNYEDVINEWNNLGCSSPWTTGRRPEFDLDHDGLPNCMGSLSPTGVHHHGRAEWLGLRGHVHGGDEGRQARVSRYREKRRTRLFSKKIRYEVRKLNAEKRPRLKGRFVKRTSLSSPLCPYLNK